MTNTTFLLRAYWLTCLLLIAMAPPLAATTIVMPTDDQLVEKAPVIIEGTVLSVAHVDRDGSIWTEATIRVERTIKGSAAGTIVVREPGGIVGDRITKVFGTPEFASGEIILLFIAPNGKGAFRTVDLFLGKFTAEAMLDGRRVWVRPNEVEQVTLLDANFRPIAAGNMQRDGVAFRAYVEGRVAGRPAPKNYGIENPLLARDFERRPGGGGAIANFTLISEPTIYRWFTFDNGGSARWYSHGTQPGYGGGGVNEVQSALAAWNGYTAARIRYSYAGTTGAAAGLERSNGVNEILFNDPLAEISGSWNPRTGGVVGQGGFNGVTHGGTWNAPFTADAQHTQRAYNAYNIVEGNLTIQDGVSPSNGISIDRLAEIISHEFGHTLGFGHSADGGALMYATVSGGGPGLREDDQVAARWLYPNGTAAPPPAVTAPAAPSSLSAAMSGSQVMLQWIDNATNESGQSIHVAAGSGAFTKIADVAAGVTSATINGFAPGTYRIYVTAFHSGGTSSPSNTATVTIAGASAVSAAFSVSPSTGVAGQTTFAFADQSSGSVTSRLWQFGDGTTSSAQNPTKVYAAAGTYTVTLTVSGDGGPSNASRQIVVTAPLQPLAAAFSFAPANPSAGQDVNFIDQSTGGVTSWQWFFGDGTMSAQQNPSKRYASAGSYTVTLTIFRNSESSSTSKTVTVAGAAPAILGVSAAFDFAPSSPSAGQSVSFADRSTGSPSGWSWNFGDGAASSAQNPVHTFAAPGTYTVTLTVSNAASSSSTSRSVTVASRGGTFTSLVPATAQTSGVGGSVWRTELNLFNAGGSSASVDLLFLPGAGASMQRRTIVLAPRQSVSYGNALLDIFGLPNGAGAVVVEAASTSATPSIRVSSRTFTGGSAGTYGQAVPGVDAADLEGTLYLTGIVSNAAFRTNVGLVNRSSSPVAATLTLYGASGTTIGIANVTVPASTFQQTSLAALFPAIGSHDALSLRVTAGGSGALGAYASVVDNTTQDPVFMQARRAPASAAVTIPAVGRASGANGTYWRSDVTLFNPTPMSMALRLRYGSSSRTLSLGGNETLVVSDVVAWFGHAAGSGPLEITSSWSAAPVVTSRTYTSAASGGTYGQSIDPIRATARDVYVPGLRSDASFRSNAGIVNDGSEALTASLALSSASGQTVATSTVTVPAGGLVQASLAALFPGVDIASLGIVTLHARSDSPSLFAYGSVVDNTSGDPVFFAGE